MPLAQKWLIYGYSKSDGKSDAGVQIRLSALWPSPPVSRNDLDLKKSKHK